MDDGNSLHLSQVPTAAWGRLSLRVCWSVAGACLPGSTCRNGPNCRRWLIVSQSRLVLVPLDLGCTESVQAAAHSVSRSTDRVDMLVNNAGLWGGRCDLGGGIDYGAVHRLYDINALGPLRIVDAFLPLTSRGLKRLAFVSSEAGSIGAARRTGKFDYCMSKAALNMAVKLMFNRLRPEGYTFRLYHPGSMRTYLGGKKNMTAEMEPEEAAALALPFFLGEREDEDRLVMVDFQGEEWPW